MKTKFTSLLGIALAAATFSAAPLAAHAATGTVVVIAEGLSPQVLELGRGYLRKSGEDAELTTAFDEVKDKAKPAPVPADALAQMSGLLQTASNNGYATGLITTGDVTKIAPLFYKLDGDVAAGLTAKDAPYDFLAGGGAANLPNASAQLTANGGTFVASSDALDGDLKGRVLVSEAPGELSYAIDRDPATEAGLSELATTALDRLEAGDRPFVLVIHDSLLKRAVDTKDTPALFEQFRELNTLTGDVVARRDDDPALKVALVMTGASAVPAFNTTSLDEQNNAFFVAANLQKSFAGGGASLKGKTVDDVTAFADADAGDYRGWKVTESDKEKIAAGTLDPEAALRAAYEPVLKLDYAATPSQAAAYTFGFDAPNGLVDALKAAVATPVK